MRRLREELQNWKLGISTNPNTLIYLNIGTSKPLSFHLGQMAKLMVLDAPVLKHIRLRRIPRDACHNSWCKIHMNYADLFTREKKKASEKSKEERAKEEDSETVTLSDMKRIWEKEYMAFQPADRTTGTVMILFTQVKVQYTMYVHVPIVIPQKYFLIGLSAFTCLQEN